MPSTYFTKLTLYGAAQIAAATAGAPINLVAMAIGDGGGSETTPNDEQIQLVNETYRATLNRLVVDAKAATKLIAELIIPESVGGWTMREVGIYDDKGKLFAVANTPPSYKPETSEGSAKTQVVRIVIKVSSTANITIFNDPSTVIATVEHVTDQFAARTVSAGTGLNGGGSLANNIELSVKYGATAETAAAGNDPRLVNAILKSMLAQETGFANDVPMSQKAISDQLIGVGQTWRDVAGSRSVETTYTNTTGRPIAVSIVGRVYGTRRLFLYVDSVAVGKTLETANNGPENQLFTIIPAGSTYYASWAGVSAGTLISWVELR